MKRTISSVHTTMKSEKTKLKSATLLRNLTEQKPIIGIDTCRSGKVSMLRRFREIREELSEAQEDPYSGILLE